MKYLISVLLVLNTHAEAKLKATKWVWLTPDNGQCLEVGELSQVKKIIIDAGLRECLHSPLQSAKGRMNVECYANGREIVFTFFSTMKACVKEKNKYKIVER